MTTSSVDSYQQQHVSLSQAPTVSSQIDQEFSQINKQFQDLSLQYQNSTYEYESMGVEASDVKNIVDEQPLNNELNQQYDFYGHTTEFSSSTNTDYTREPFYNEQIYGTSDIGPNEVIISIPIIFLNLNLVSIGSFFIPLYRFEFS